MSEHRAITVSDLLRVFASALLALTPFAERVSMPWRDGESYDDWDAIAEALWKSLVVGTMADAISTDFPLHLPRYGFTYDAYPFSDAVAISGAGFELLVVQQVVLDGAHEVRINAARVRLADRARLGYEVARLDGRQAWLVRFRADGTEERICEIAIP